MNSKYTQLVATRRSEPPAPQAARAALLLVTILLAACAQGQETTRSAPPTDLSTSPVAIAPTAAPTPTPTPAAQPTPTPSPVPTPTPGPTKGWLLAATAVRAAASGKAGVQIRLGANFPLTVLPATKTAAGVQWVQVTPLTVAKAKTGWVPASAVTTAKPGGTTSAGFDALDPALAAYLARHGTNVGATVFDMTRGVTYRYDSGLSFITASSVKLPIMLTLLRQLEAAGRRPTGDEVALLTAMIELSDNDAATALDLEIGDRAGLQRFAATFGLAGFVPRSTYDGGWGWATITPDAMVRLLTLFQQGKVLSSAADTRLARTLMSHVEDEQRVGLGTTAPAGSTVLLKTGWTPGPDGLWVANSSGIVITRRATWVVAVYTDHLASLDQGLAILDHVCAAVAARLK